MPVPDEYHEHAVGEQPTNVLILPGFTMVEKVTPNLVPDLIRYFVDRSATTTTPLGPQQKSSSGSGPGEEEQDKNSQRDITSLTPLRSVPCPHAAVILLCSHRTRDARCGQSAPLLRREFERHLRPLGLQRDLEDNRPGGVGIYFINHVGGHKYSANVFVYRRRNFDWYKSEANNESAEGGGEKATEDEGAAQGVWLARVRPEDCENIVKFTILKGKVVKPRSQLRGGFDRERKLVSW